MFYDGEKVSNKVKSDIFCPEEPAFLHFVHYAKFLEGSKITRT